MKSIKFLSISSIVLCASPIAFIVSCSSSSEVKDVKINQTEELKKIMKQNPIGAKQSEKKYIKGLIEIESHQWNNKDSFFKTLEQYFEIGSLKEKLSNDIYNEIKKISIQPKFDSKNVSLIFYLRSPYSNTNVVDVEVKDANLENGFPNKKIVKNTTHYDNTKDFDDAWSKAKKGDKEKVNEILEKAFGDQFNNLATSLPDNNKKFSDYFDFVKLSNNSIFLEAKKDAIKEGYIFDKDGEYSFETTSTSLIKK